MDKSEPKEKKSVADKINDLTLSAVFIMCAGYLGTIMFKETLPLLGEIWKFFH